MTLVKATTTAVRKKSKFKVPDELREMAAKCRDQVSRRISGRGRGGSLMRGFASLAKEEMA